MSDEIIQALRLEDILLNHLAIPESVIVLCRENVTSEFILDTEPDIKNAFQFVLDYVQQYGEAPPVSVISTETGYDEFEEPDIPVGFLVEKLRERYQRREIREILRDVTKLSADPKAALDRGFSELARIKVATTPVGSSLDTSEVASVLDRYEERKTLGPGFTFGFQEIDQKLGGMRRNELYFGFGRVKMGKSWLFAVSPAVMGLLQGKSSLIYTLELSEEEMHDRITCMLAEVSYGRFRDHLLSQTEINNILEVDEYLKSQDAKIHIRRPPLGERNVPSLVENAKQFDVECVFIDQLPNLEATKMAGKDKWVQLMEICSQLKDAARHWPIMVMGQLNREAAAFGEMAEAVHIGLGDAPAQTGDLLLALWANKEMRENNLLEYGVMEARAYGEFTRWSIKKELNMSSSYRVLGIATDP